jgi:hypothetical protein
MVDTRRARAGTVLAAIVVAGLCAAAPAPADPPGLVKVGATSVANSFNKTLTVSCPHGTVVTGGGGYLTASPSAQGHVSLTQLEPLDDGTGFRAAMREIKSTPDNWRLSTDALCATAPLGWDVVPVTGPVNTQVVTASCGTKNLIGVGGRINNGRNQVILDYVVPSSTLKSVTVRGTPVPGATLTSWSVTAFAVCANVHTPTLVSFAIPLSGAAHKALNSTCPSGTGLYSVGAAISPGNGRKYLDVVHAISTHQYSVAADEADGDNPLDWALIGYGICG